MNQGHEEGQKRRGSRIGISGGVGAGKSRVLDWLKEVKHARVIPTDDVAKELMEPGEEGYCRVVEALGTCFLEKDGRINRSYLAKMIFTDPKVKETVDKLTHPLVWKALERMIDQAEEEGFRLIVVESALFSPSVLEFLDEIWLIDAPKEVRVKRLMESRGYSRERCESMLASQPGQEEYLKTASQVIHNGGSWEETVTELERLTRHKF